MFQRAAACCTVVQRVAVYSEYISDSVRVCIKQILTHTHRAQPKKNNLRMGWASVFQFQFQFFTLNLNNSDKPKSRGVDCDRAHMN